MELACSGGKEDKISSNLPCSSCLEGTHIWIRDRGSNMRGFSSTIISPHLWQSWTEPGTLITLCSPCPPLSASTSNRDWVDLRLLPAEEPDFSVLCPAPHRLSCPHPAGRGDSEAFVCRSSHSTNKQARKISEQWMRKGRSSTGVCV